MLALQWLDAAELRKVAVSGGGLDGVPSGSPALKLWLATGHAVDLYLTYRRLLSAAPTATAAPTRRRARPLLSPRARRAPVTLGARPRQPICLASGGVHTRLPSSRSGRGACSPSQHEAGRLLRAHTQCHQPHPCEGSPHNLLQFAAPTARAALGACVLLLCPPAHPSRSRRPGWHTPRWQQPGRRSRLHWASQPPPAAR